MTTALPKVFISYRRSDSLAATGRLYDRLNTAYPGMFFRDVSGIGVGVDFAKEIERAVSSSVALIAVIGPAWATESVDGKRRLEDPDDFVRLEVLNALKTGHPHHSCPGWQTRQCRRRSSCLPSCIRSASGTPSGWSRSTTKRDLSG